MTLPNWNVAGSRLRIAVGGLAAVLALPPVSGAAQSPDDRRILQAFRDSIATVADTASLRSLESRLLVSAGRDRANPSMHISLGYLALQLGDPTDAVAEFKWATELAPRWPSAWYAWGQAELRLGDEVTNAATNRQLLLARDAWPRAARAFARAFQLDTGFVAVALDETRRAVRAGRADWAGVVRDGLRRAVAERPRAVSLLLGLGRMQRLIGDTTGALATFDSLTALPDGRGLGLLELARTRLAAGDDRGIEVYFAAAAENDSVTVSALREDLTWIASPEELAAFDSSQGSSRAQFLWDFWTGRDRDDLRRTGARLTEHYRRLAVVADRYPDPRDVRARVLVRQGEPDTRASLAAPGLPPNESWWYHRPEGDFVVHFVAREDTAVYTPVESVFDIPGQPVAVRVSGAGDEADPPAGVDADRLLRSRAPLAPFYQAAVAARREVLAAFRTRERALGRLGMKLALTTDRNSLRFTRDLAARVRIASAYEAGGSAGVRLFFAVPGFALADSDSARVDYPLRIRLDARDTAAAVDRALDTTVVISAPAGGLAPGGRLAGSVWLPLPPGHYDVRAAVGYHNVAGTLIPAAEVEVPREEPGVLALYDLLVGGSDAPARFTPPGEAPVGVDPGAAFDRADVLTIYSWVRGLESPVTGRARVLVRPITGPEDKRGRWRGFPGWSGWVEVPLTPDSAGVSPVRVTVPLRRLDRGAWELELVVVDPAGRTARQQARLAIGQR